MKINSQHVKSKTPTLMELRVETIALNTLPCVFFQVHAMLLCCWMWKRNAAFWTESKETNGGGWIDIFYHPLYLCWNDTAAVALFVVYFLCCSGVLLLSIKLLFPTAHAKWKSFHHNGACVKIQSSKPKHLINIHLIKKININIYIYI